jgi:nucleoside-diphosphate-sugar epimerase
MTIALVTGAGGFVGSQLCRHLEHRGIGVRAVGRRSPVGVLEPREHALDDTLAGVDVVYYLAAIAHEGVVGSDAGLLNAVNVEAPVRWLHAAERVGVRRFVWLSSIKVLGDIGAEPLSTNAPYRPSGAYAHSKQHAEQRLLGERLQRTSLAVVRPPLVYGPGVRGNFLALLRWSASGAPLPLARATAPRSLVGVGNLCDLLLRLGQNGEGVFHVADPADISVAELISRVRRLHGRPPRLVPIPPAVLRRVAHGLGYGDVYSRLFEPLRVDASATAAELRWRPPLTLSEQLEETVAWFRSSR